jgi:CheY-like chemotaxis protein
MRSAGGRREAKLEGSDATILLVDDDGPVRAVTAAMLQDLGYHVRDVASGDEALAVLAQDGGVDVLLTDLVMPGMNGSQLAAAVRAAHPDVSIVFISGYADQVGGALSPDDRLVRKPFGTADLHRAVEAALGERRRVLSKACPQALGVLKA